MDAIRSGAASDSIFAVAYLKVVDGEGARLAFAEVSPASASSSPFRGWLLLKRETGEKWQVLWGVEQRDYSSCLRIAGAYRNAVSAAERFETDMSLFSPGFRATRIGLAARTEGQVCKGRVLVNADGL